MQYQDASEKTTTRCPTCGARQTISPVCRRCKCDLALVAGVLQRKEALRRESLRHLQDENYGAALAAARRSCELAFDEETARLLAITYLRLGRYQAALDVYDALENQ